MAEEAAPEGKKLTGKHVFAIFFTAFAIIIGVNVFMAFKAVGTFPGLEVKNSYIASQSFDEDRAAQEALGWTVTAAIEGDEVLVDIAGMAGTAAPVQSVEGMIGRTTIRTDDQELVFAQNADGVHVAKIAPVDAGKWEVRVLATAPDGTPFRQRLIVVVPES